MPSIMRHPRVPARKVRIEMRVVNSRFIATLAPVFTVVEAREFIAHVEEEFDDASHNVPAFLIGHGASVVAHCSDDGEPSGTAGRPALAVLRGSGLGDVAVVVTRYFGGTKLGTGGLVRAYGDAVREVLKVTPLAEKVETHTVLMAVPYALFEQVRLLVADYGGHILDEEFAVDVTMTVRFATDRFPGFQQAVRNLSAGKIEALVMETNPSTIMPLTEKGA